MDSDFHTLGGFGDRERKEVGLPLIWGRREAEGLYVGHLSAGEKGGGLLGGGLGDRGKLLVMHSRFPSPLCWESHLYSWVWWS